jgi:hypothetical protein
VLTSNDIGMLAMVAAVLLPGDDGAPSASDVPELDSWLVRAIDAVGDEIEALRAALAIMPAVIDWNTVRDFAAANPEEFELIAAVAAGAYFMAPQALDAIGYPRGSRKAPRIDQAADEIGTGVLDAVMDRDPMFRQVPA